MWFDVHAALAEIDHAYPALQSRVVHVAHVARLPASNSEMLAVGDGCSATVTYALLDRLLARGRLVMSREGEWRLAAQKKRQCLNPSVAQENGGS